MATTMTTQKLEDHFMVILDPIMNSFQLPSKELTPKQFLEKLQEFAGVARKMADTIDQEVATLKL